MGRLRLVSPSHEESSGGGADGAGPLYVLGGAQDKGKRKIIIGGIEIVAKS